jgi:hypothetical protein
MPQEQKDDSVAELCRRLFSSNLKDDESVEEPRISTDHEVALTKSRAVISSESVRQHWAPQFEPNLLLSTSTTSTRKGKETLRLEPLQRAEYFPSLLSSSSTTSKVGPCVGVPQSLNLCAQSTALEPNGRQLSTTTVEETTRQGARTCCMKTCDRPSTSCDLQQELVAVAHRALDLDKLTDTCTPTFSPVIQKAEKQTSGPYNSVMAFQRSPSGGPTDRFPCRWSDCIMNFVNVPSHDCLYEYSIWAPNASSFHVIHGDSRSYRRSERKHTIHSVLAQPLGTNDSRGSSISLHRACGSETRPQPVQKPALPGLGQHSQETLGQEAMLEEFWGRFCATAWQQHPSVFRKPCPTQTTSDHEELQLEAKDRRDSVQPDGSTLHASVIQPSMTRSSRLISFLEALLAGDNRTRSSSQIDPSEPRSAVEADHMTDPKDEDEGYVMASPPRLPSPEHDYDHVDLNPSSASDTSYTATPESNDSSCAVPLPSSSQGPSPGTDDGFELVFRTSSCCTSCGSESESARPSSSAPNAPSSSPPETLASLGSDDEFDMLGHQDSSSMSHDSSEAPSSVASCSSGLR